jgi:hypothetical protein
LVEKERKARKTSRQAGELKLASCTPMNECNYVTPYSFRWSSRISSHSTVFSLTTDQRTVLSAIINQRNEQALFRSNSIRCKLRPKELSSRLRLSGRSPCGGGRTRTAASRAARGARARYIMEITTRIGFPPGAVLTERQVARTYVRTVYTNTRLLAVV